MDPTNGNLVSHAALKNRENLDMEEYKKRL